MFTRHYWLGESGVLVRAIRTAAQTAIAALGVGTTNLFSADLKNIAALSASAAVLSVLMSLDRSSSVDNPAVRSHTDDTDTIRIPPVTPPEHYAYSAEVPQLHTTAGHVYGESLR